MGYSLLGRRRGSDDGMMMDDEDFDFEGNSRSGNGGRSRRGRLLLQIRNKLSRREPHDDEEEPEDSSSSSYDREDDLYGLGGLWHGIKKRGKKLAKSQSKSKRKAADKKAKKSKKKDASESKTAKHGRRSVHDGHGKLSRAMKASRALRAFSVVRKLNDDEEEGEEEKDVAMPLPSSSASSKPVRRPESSIGEHNPMVASLRTSSKKRSFGLIRDKLVRQRNTNNSSDVATSSDNTRGQSDNRIPKAPRRTSSNNSQRSRPKPRRKFSSDQSVDTLPSVASTEFSLDGRSVQQPGTSTSQFYSSIRGPTGLPTLLFKKRKNKGVIVPVASMDYYSESIPWIIKNWIYFLTVVVPFGICYFCFVGIFHSSTLHQNLFLKKVSISNLLFVGLGCTWRSHFKARQALDARGVFAVYTPESSFPTSSSSPSGRKLPRRSKNRSRDSTGGGYNPRGSTTAVSMAPLRKIRRRTMDMMSKSIAIPQGLERKMTRSFSFKNSNPSSRRSSATGGTGTSSMAKAWDSVESLLPSPHKEKRHSQKMARPTMNKHTSILEIYEGHARDEHMAILQ